MDMKRIEFSGFRGLVNAIANEGLSPSDLITGLNIDIDDDHRLLRRSGSTLLVSATAHSLWAEGDICLYVDSGVLKQLNADYSTRTIRSGMGDTEVSYTRIGENVYYSNEDVSGVFSAGISRSWGLTVPSAPGLSAGAGGLPDGDYQVILTHVRSDGQESGSSEPTRITVSDGGSITVTLVEPTDTDVDFINIYATPPDGGEFYLVTTVDATASSYTINSEIHDWILPLDTQYLRPPPLAHIVAQHGGYILLAVGPYLFNSEPLSPELFDLRKYTPFPSKITMIAVVNDGVYIGTNDQTIFLQGKDPTELEFYGLDNHGVIEGTLSYVKPEKLGGFDKVRDELVPVWTSPEGIYVGLPGGNMVNLTGNRFKFDGLAERGTSLVARHHNADQYITIVKEK